LARFAIGWLGEEAGDEALHRRLAEKGDERAGFFGPERDEGDEAFELADGFFELGRVLEEEGPGAENIERDAGFDAGDFARAGAQHFVEAIGECGPALD